MASSPTEAAQNTRVGGICDRCNAGIRTGDPARFYTTLYPDSGWLLRRVWCADCGESKVDPPTGGADEAIGEAIWWSHALLGVRIIDRSDPNDGDPL